MSASVWWLSSVASKDNALSLNQQPLAPSAHSGTAESAGVWLSARSLASSAKPVPGSILTWGTQRSLKCLICAYAPDLSFFLGTAHCPFKISYNKQPSWTPGSGGGLAASPTAPTQSPQLDCKAFLYTHIPPLDKQSCSLFHGPASSCSHASSTSAHSIVLTPLYSLSTNYQHSKP